MLMLISATFFPHAFGWIYPDGTEDDRFETFGPRADRLLIKLYYDYNSEFLALTDGGLDLTSSPLDTGWGDVFDGPPYDEYINIEYCADRRRMFVITINTNNDQFLGDPPDPEYENPVYPNPCSEPGFRHALAHLVNRSYAVEEWGGFAAPAYTLVPPSMPNYTHPDIVPGGSLGNCCHLIDLAEATTILDTYDGDDTNTAPDFPIASETGLRIWDRDGDGKRDDGEDISLVFYADISDMRMDGFALDFAENLLKVKIPVAPCRSNYVFGPIGSAEGVNGCYVSYVSKTDKVLGDKDFHLFTGYLDLGPTPEHLAMFIAENYQHPDECLNFGALNCPQYDLRVDDLMFATTIQEAKIAAYEAQKIFADPACGGIGCIPIAYYIDYKAVRKNYSGGNDGDPVDPDDGENKYRGSNWRGIVNMPSRGPDNWWSLLNMYPESHLVGDGPMMINWGYTGDCGRLNPLNPYTSLDCEVFSLVYDSLLKQNPYTGEWIPWLCENFRVGAWKDPNTLEFKTKVTFTIRNDVYWHDGTPFTIADVAYTLCELPKLLSWFPKWSGNSRWIRSFYIIDPLNIEILFEVSSVWAPFWIGSNIILPKHVWKPIVDYYLETLDLEVILGFAPDPHLIGSGPWRFVDYVPDVRVYLEANKPGKIVHGITSPGYWQLQPIHANITTGNFKVKIDPGYPNNVTLVNFTLNLHNLWLNQSSNGILLVNEYIYLDNNLILEEDNISLESDNATEEHFQLSLAKCKHEIKAAVHVVGPPWLDALHSNPWICKWINVTIPIWITIKQDIGGAMYQGKVPAPDCKVDGKDIAYASSSYNTVPGMKKWSPVADITGDYKVDGKDIANIAKFYGKW
jgi:ABC-type transport system substrate-binding protein